MTTSASYIIKCFLALEKKEQLQLVQLFISHLADIQNTNKEITEIDSVVEKPRFTYQASIPVLSKDWEQSEDDNWDNY
ncbi:MAG: hypothetical protein AAGG68_15660 [Bacteroidota bacterium]